MGRMDEILSVLEQDIWVVYCDDEDQGHYTAHSIETDQIGMGRSVVEAIVELARNAQVLLHEAKRNPRLNILVKAPPEIQDMARRANDQGPCAR